MPIVVVATLDTKGPEAAFARDRVRTADFETLVVDVGSMGPPAFAPDVAREVVWEKAGVDGAGLARSGDRGEAVEASARGVARVVEELWRQGRVEGVLGLGGSAGTVIGTSAMRALPFGVPKVMVSTLASGPTRPFVGGSDIAMFYPVADLAGLNRITRVVLANAAAAMVGMVRGRAEGTGGRDEGRPLVTATMFGVTTPCVERARARLEGEGVEVIVFHATGVGGQSMEGLVRDGRVAGVLDLTTTEIADEVVGGTLSAGPDRLKPGIAARVPQVVSLGALDMVNFGPRATVPERFGGRLLHAHNPSVTLMRTTPEENGRIGAWMAEALGRATVPMVLMIPRGGVSALDAPGKAFHDPEADGALFRALRERLDGHPLVRIDDRDEHINDPAFAEAAVGHLNRLMGRELLA